METQIKEKLAIKSAENGYTTFDQPLDYTFMCLTAVSDCLEEQPREGYGKKSPRKENDSADAADKKRKTNALRLSNNVITDWTEFSATIEKLVTDPTDLEWIDLSFNDLTTINECILQYKNLKVLYLHGNSIEKINEIDKLAALPQLRTLTLHGNPVEDSRKGYRQYVLSKLPLLKTFDFSGITRADRACADTWSQMSKTKQRKK